MAVVNTLDFLDFWDLAYQDNSFTSECGDGSIRWLSPGYIGGAYYANPWSTLFLNDVSKDGQCPGIVDVRITRQRAIDKKKPAGNDVGTVTTHGIMPAEFEIDITIWTPDQWYCFKRWLELPRKTITTVVKAGTPLATTQSTTTPVAAIPGATITQGASATLPVAAQTSTTTVSFLPKSGKNPPSNWNCYHPVLNAHGINNLIITGMTGPHRHGITRAKTITLKCVEWAQKQTGKSTTSTPGSIPSSQLTILPPPGAAVAQQIQAQQGGGISSASNNFNQINAGSTAVPLPTSALV